MESNNTNSIVDQEYLRLMHLASMQRASTHVHDTHKRRTITYTLATTVAAAMLILVFALNTDTKTDKATVYATLNGREITDLQEAQQYAKSTLQIFSQTLEDIASNTTNYTPL